MSVQIALGAPATRVASRKLGPVAGSRSRRTPSAPAACADEHVGEHVRQMRDERQHAVVRVGLDRRRPRTERGHRAGGGARSRTPLVGSVGVRYQVAPVEQVGPGVMIPAVSAPASGWPPTNRWSSVAGDDRALGRADVGDDAAGRGGRQDLTDGPRQCTDRHCHESHAPPPRPPRRASPRRSSTAPRSSAAATAAGSASQPLTAAPARSRAASATEPPIRPRPTTATRMRRFAAARRARTAAARLSRTVTVSSQSMQPSVIDWP